MDTVTVILFVVWAALIVIDILVANQKNLPGMTALAVLAFFAAPFVYLYVLAAPTFRPSKPS